MPLLSRLAQQASRARRAQLGGGPRARPPRLALAAGGGGALALALGGAAAAACDGGAPGLAGEASLSGVRLRRHRHGAACPGGFRDMTVEDLKAALEASGQRGVVLDIDETLSATNVAWFQRLEELFGNPEGAPIDVLIEKYKLAQYVPFWQSEEALAWMQRQRDSPEAQDALPLIPGAAEGVSRLGRATPIVGYCTVRPRSVSPNTIAWLRESGFPELPVVSKPVSVPFADGNKWKAGALHHLWPEVTGIVDDNPKVAMFAGKEYPGKLFLFSHSSCLPEYDHAIPCNTWQEVVAAALVHLA